jgi:hypothetical protein
MLDPCMTGYYCTTDGKKNTYCCPGGQDTLECAAAISLTVSLIRETGSVVIPSASASGAKPTSVSAPPTLPTHSAAQTTAAPPEFTGAAAKVAGAGITMLAGAAGFAGLL